MWTLRKTNSWQGPRNDGSFKLGISVFFTAPFPPTSKLLEDVIVRYGRPDHVDLLQVGIGTNGSGRKYYRIKLLQLLLKGKWQQYLSLLHKRAS